MKFISFNKVIRCTGVGKMKNALLTMGLVLACFSVVSPTTVHAIPVGTELVLLADVSGSLDAADFALQRDGYAAAFRDAGVIGLIEATPGGIATTLVYWSDGQSMVTAWTHITDAASAEAFAVAIENAARPSSGSTGLTDAMIYGTGLLTGDNGFESERWVIDVSGDGAESVKDAFNDDVCETCQAARDAAVASGVDMINALWIDDRDFFGDDAADIIDAVPYGENNVIAGIDSFAHIVDNFNSFAGGIREKIFIELGPQGVPEPATLFLLGAGIMGLAGMKRRKIA